MNFAQLKEQYGYVEQTYGRFDLDIAKGSGAQCEDLAGKKYIDFTSGIGVNSLGFCDKAWAKAVSDQLLTLQHTSNLYYTQPGGELAEMLCKATGMAGVFFSNSGAEANEGAIKAARKYSRDKYGEGRADIITLINSFHGRTMATLSATGQEVFHNHFHPFLEGFSHVEAGNITALEGAITPATCAVMLEVVQGEGGVVPLPKGYLQAVQGLCKKHDIILIVDEVQTGIGRTGSLFAYQQFDLAPDIVTMAKGLGGGLPIGGVMFAPSTHGVLSAGTHATTFGGGPAVCAGGCEVMRRVMADGFLSEVSAKGKYITDKLLALPEVEGVDGLGLMLGVRLADGIEAADVVKKGMQEGVLTLTAKTKLRLLPPLNITYEEIDEGLSAIERALKN